ncbi:MAG: carbohydrate ABC transporter permease, partial [candidate division NC10 bacterium]
MAAVRGTWWMRWVSLYLPLGAIVILTLFPFYYMAVTAVRPDREMYIPWDRPNFAPFWTLSPTLEHFALLFRETLFARWLVNTLFIALMSTG